MEDLLTFKTIKKPEDIVPLQLENGSLSRILDEAFHNQIKKTKETKQIVYRGEIVGYFIMSIGHHQDKSDICGTGDENYAAMYLDLLAVDKNSRKKGIGSITIRYIIDEAKKVSRFAGCRYLLMDALNDKIDFYKNRGFAVYERGEVTSLMGMDFRDQLAVEAYVDGIAQGG